MPRIAKDNNYQTVITTFELTPGTAQDLMDVLREAYAGFISKQHGFIGAALHINDAQTRIANYSLWKRRDDFLAMIRTPEVREYNRRFGELCKSFEPVLYDVAETYD